MSTPRLISLSNAFIKFDYQRHTLRNKTTCAIFAINPTHFCEIKYRIFPNVPVHILLVYTPDATKFLTAQTDATSHDR